jgi:hypothetical protein
MLLRKIVSMVFFFWTMAFQLSIPPDPQVFGTSVMFEISKQEEGFRTKK